MPLCERLSVSLVINRQTPIYGPDERAALAGFFDELVTSTGAEVVIHPNAGAEAPPPYDCTLDPAWAAGTASHSSRAAVRSSRLGFMAVAPVVDWRWMGAGGFAAGPAFLSLGSLLSVSGRG